MAKPVSIPNSFATSTAAIPLSYLDQDFNALANSTNDLATYSNYVADTGAANAYIANFPTNTNTSSLTAGLRVQFKAANANSGASTLNVQVNSVSIGSGSIVLTDGTALPANAIVANAVVDVIYDGSNFQIINDASGAAETISNLTVTNNATIGGNLTVDTNTLYVDSVNNRVGIGTASPTQELEVTGTIRSSLSAADYSFGATTSGGGSFFIEPDDYTLANPTWEIRTNANEPLAFQIGGSERMRIDSSGNVGIGTSSPGQKLDVVGNMLLSGQSTADQYIRIGSGRSGNGYSYLDLQGDTTYASGLRLIRLNSGANASSNIEHSGTGSLNLVTQHAANIQFYTNGANERMRIDSSGNLLVGTTADWFSRRAVIEGGEGVVGIVSAVGSFPVSCVNQATSGDNTFQGFWTEAKASPSLRGSITYNRGAGLTAYNTTSDQRLKENIADASSALSKIDSVKIRSFDWKETGNHVDFGVIAQELIEVAPECVTKGQDNEDGTIKNAWSVDTSALVPALVKAIQEQQETIKALETRIQTLENK